VTWCPSRANARAICKPPMPAPTTTISSSFIFSSHTQMRDYNMRQFLYIGQDGRKSSIQGHWVISGSNRDLLRSRHCFPAILADMCRHGVAAGFENKSPWHLLRYRAVE
jgi:hypothetical protein